MVNSQNVFVEDGKKMGGWEEDYVFEISPSEYGASRNSDTLNKYQPRGANEMSNKVGQKAGNRDMNVDGGEDNEYEERDDFKNRNRFQKEESFEKFNAQPNEDEGSNKNKNLAKMINTTNKVQTLDRSGVGRVVRGDGLVVEVRVEKVVVEDNVFMDVDYSDRSDNNYMLSKPTQFPHEKFFVNVTKKFCRYYI